MAMSSRAPTHFVVVMNYEGIVAALLNAGGDVNIRNNSDHTGHLGGIALRCAAFWRRYEIARLLIDARAYVKLKSTNSAEIEKAFRERQAQNGK